MVLGGGGVGESKKATARTAMVDLKTGQPRLQARPRTARKNPLLEQRADAGRHRLHHAAAPPTTGAGAAPTSSRAQFYDPKANAFREAADPTIGRNYHSEALLLPDGRVATFGSDSLFGDKDNTKLGKFEQRMEVYTPPYLYRDKDKRPALGDGPEAAAGDGRATFRTDHPERVVKARLMRPSAVTHTTDVEQRSIELGLTKDKNSVTITVPKDRALVPPGWYMVFVTDQEGTPSEAKWLRVD